MCVCVCSIIDIASSYLLEGSGLEFRHGPRIFFSPKPSRPSLGSAHPPIQYVPGLFPGVKRLEHEVDQLRLMPSLRMTGAIPLLRSYAFMP